MRHPIPVSILAITSVMVIAACGTSGAEQPLTPIGNGAVRLPAASAAPVGTVHKLTATTRIAATESEFHIRLSRTSLKHGRVTFTVRNAGELEHALTIDGPGVEDRSTGLIAPGATRSLTVTLRTGRYQIYCPVGDHRAEGMSTSLRAS